VSGGEIWRGFGDVRGRAQETALGGDSHCCVVEMVVFGVDLIVLRFRTGMGERDAVEFSRSRAVFA
jgi:hypothetical protein